MKKLLLSGLAFFAGLTASFAQVAAIETDTVPRGFGSEGYFPALKYAGDNFTKRQQWDNVYWWTQAKPVVNVLVDSSNLDGICRKDSLQFYYKATRLGDGKLSYVLTQRYGLYEPIGVGFGTTGTKQNVLDLSNGNAVIIFKIANTSTKNFKVRASLQDSLKNEVNAVGINTAGNVYKDELEGLLDAGQTKTFTFNYNPTATATPYKSKYIYDDCHRGTGDGRDETFNPAIVSAVTITIINQDNSADTDGYKPYTLNQVTFDLLGFHVGSRNIATGLDEATIKGSVFKIAPNPASSYIEFTESKNVNIIDAMGKVVYSTPLASRIDVSNMTKGVYLIQTSLGSSRFVVE